MRYSIKTYDGERYLLIKDPYTNSNLEAINTTRFEDEDLLVLNLLAYFNYYDFKKDISYAIYVKSPDNQNTMEYYTDVLTTILNIPKTQASQLLLIAYNKKDSEFFALKTTKSFQEVYSIAHNLLLHFIDYKIVLK